VTVAFVTEREQRFERIDAWLRAHLTPLDAGDEV
jgi:hypothetical protein